jgi:short-subunit dehydrogenase
MPDSFFKKEDPFMNVLITGASGGLGRAFAIDCAKRGFRLFLTDLNEGGLIAVKQGLLRQYDCQVLIKSCDLTNSDDVNSLADYAKAQNFQLDMLLNVAGIDYEGGFTQRDFAQISSILNVNIEATLRITHHALKLRKPDHRLYIVFISSLASLYPIPLKATYAASKRFLLDFSIALGQELKGQNASVLSVCPGGLCTTQETLCAIAAQGFWGNATTNRVEKVVHQSITYALRNRRIYIPGLLNRLLGLTCRFVPPASLPSCCIKDGQKPKSNG